MVETYERPACHSLYLCQSFMMQVSSHATRSSVPTVQIDLAERTALVRVI